MAKLRDLTLRTLVTALVVALTGAVFVLISINVGLTTAHRFRLDTMRDHVEVMKRNVLIQDAAIQSLEHDLDELRGDARRATEAAEKAASAPGGQPASAPSLPPCAGGSPTR